MYNLTITTCFVLILIFCFICVFNTVSAFNLYIESDEMNRTLGKFNLFFFEFFKLIFI